MTQKGRLTHARLVAAALVVAVFVGGSTLSIAGQDKEKQATDKKEQQKKQSELEKKDDTKVPTGKEIPKEVAKQEIKLTPVEAIVEFAIVAYGTRKQLELARSAATEEGTIRLVTESGDLNGRYLLRTMRRAKTWEDLLRVDLDLNTPASTDRPGGDQTIKYTVAFNGASVWSAQNGQYITPRPEAEAAFKAQLTREYLALLRYKEDGSKLELIGPENVVGVDTNVVEMTNTNGEKTRYWISAKSFRIVHCEYELLLAGNTKPTKYRLSYYYSPVRVVQNTLIPTRRVMTQDGKFVQEIIIGPITLSAKLDPEVFQHLQEQ
jgi:hypothetical protein